MGLPATLSFSLSLRPVSILHLASVEGQQRPGLFKLSYSSDAAATTTTLPVKSFSAAQASFALYYGRDFCQPTVLQYTRRHQ